MADYVLPPTDTAEQNAAHIVAQAHYYGLAQMPGFNFGHFIQHVAHEAVSVVVDNAPDLADIGVDLAGEVIGAIVS